MVIAHIRLNANLLMELENYDNTKIITINIKQKNVRLFIPKVGVNMDKDAILSILNIQIKYHILKWPK